MAQKKRSAQDELSLLLVRLYSLAGALPWWCNDASPHLPNIVAVFPGCREVTRVMGGALLARMPAISCLVICGMNQAERERGDQIWDQTSLWMGEPKFGLSARLPPKRTVIIPEAGHTRDQCVQLLDWYDAEPEAHGIVLVASGWHLPRAALTLIKQALKRHAPGKRLPQIIPVPAEWHLWNGVIEGTATHPETSKSEATSAELRKICAYQAEGDVATLADFEQYLAITLL